jgi:hypothetical protein
MKNTFIFILFLSFFFSVNAQDVYYDNGLFFDPMTEKYRYNLKDKRWTKFNLTYYIKNESKHLTAAVRQSTIQEAFKVWSNVCGLTFSQVSSPNADIDIAWASGEHGCSSKLDDTGENGVNLLAHTVLRLYNDGTLKAFVHFDEGESSWNGEQLLSTAIHELGHAIGLDHSTASGSIMRAMYGGQTFLGMDDILGIQQLYGPDKIKGPVLMNSGSTATFTLSNSYSNYVFQTSPNLTHVSLSDNTLNYRASGRGSGYINAYDRRHDMIIAQIKLWIGAPVISSITNTGSILKIETLGVNASVSQTQWTIGGNTFTAYDDFISIPYSSGTYTVSVRAYNQCGWSDTYNTQITFGRASYNIAIDANSRSLTILPKSTDWESQNILAASTNNIVTYTIVDILTGSLKASGTLPAIGGTINLSNYSDTLKRKKG